MTVYPLSSDSMQSKNHYVAEAMPILNYLPNLIWYFVYFQFKYKPPFIISYQHKVLPAGHWPQVNDPGRLIHGTLGSAEQRGPGSEHSSRSTTHMGLEPLVVQPSSQIHVYLGYNNQTHVKKFPLEFFWNLFLTFFYFVLFFTFTVSQKKLDTCIRLLDD